MIHHLSPCPTVSIIIPAYNVDRYIEAALQSLQSQTLTDFEALIVDDGSTDRTAEVVQIWIAQDPRFKLLQKPNGGLSSARNFGIHHATSPYIALLDADDLYLPDKLQSHVNVLDRDPTVGVVYSESQAITDDGSPTWVKLSGKPIDRDPLKSLLCKNFIGHGSNAIFRKSILETVGDFDETLTSVEDLDLWLRIASLRTWTFHRVPTVQCYYRVRPAGLSFNVEHMQQTQERVMGSAFVRHPALTAALAPTAYAYMYRYLARISMTSGDEKRAQDFMNQAWKANSRIFFADPRSLITLLAVKLAPLAKLAISRSLSPSSQS